jgi:hypothetical protein
MKYTNDSKTACPFIHLHESSLNIQHLTDFHNIWYFGDIHCKLSVNLILVYISLISPTLHKVLITLVNFLSSRLFIFISIWMGKS